MTVNTTSVATKAMVTSPFWPLIHTTRSDNFQQVSVDAENK